MATSDSISRTFYENGKLAAEEHFTNGNLDGLAKTYYRNGQIESEYNYKDGVRHGLCKDYDIYGRVVKEEHYMEGISDGNIKRFFYHVNGKLKREESCNESEEIDGWLKLYDEAGNLIFEEFFKNGISDGIAKKKIYRSNGLLEKIEIHKEVDNPSFPLFKRKLITKIYWYDTEGKLESIENYNEGKLNGIVKTYREGKLDFLYRYNYGSYVTTLMRCSYHSNGQIKTKANYKQGVVTRYNKNGQIQSKSYYKGRRIERKLEFYENGKLKSEKYYMRGKLKTEKSFCHSTGNIIIKLYFEDGKLKSEEITKQLDS